MSVICRRRHFSIEICPSGHYHEKVVAYFECDLYENVAPVFANVNRAFVVAHDGTSSSLPLMVSEDTLKPLQDEGFEEPLEAVKRQTLNMISGLQR
ncbi:hypothetical protein Tco_0626772 [Tanacetum coccineum]|uniref:Uncharacterized protein n=1 Tax=Tanacetum coccineum TaxID=301880 RepID=A0ABQ4WKH4_9ASTR